MEAETEPLWEDILKARGRTIAMLVRWLGSPEAAEDLWQEAARRFCEARQKAQFTSEGPASGATYFHRIVLNTCRNQLQRNNTARAAIEALPKDRTQAPPESSQELSELRCAIVSALETLPPHWALVVQKIALEQGSIQEVAELLNVTPALVSLWFFRAKALLRDKLQPWLRHSEDDRP